MPRFARMRGCAAGVLVTALLALPASAGAAGPWDSLLAPVTACPGQTDASLPAATQRQAMVCMQRWARAQKGLGGVHVSRQLKASSGRKARDIERCQDFSHNACGRNAFYWFQREHFFRGVFGGGEILALGSGTAATVRGTMSNWLNSDLHRSVILDPRWDDIGVGLVHGRFQGYADVAIWVAHFGYHR